VNGGVRQQKNINAEHEHRRSFEVAARANALSGYVERKEMPGLVALVSHHDDVHVEALGTMLVGHPAPMKRDAIFRIASLAKPITAVAAMILVEECKLRLDESIEPWLPELANRRVLKSISSQLDDTAPALRAITVRDLLTSRMGFGSVMAMPDTYPIQKLIRENLIGGDGPMLPYDYFAFSCMMLNKGRHGHGQVLSRATVELMTSDQLTPKQRAGSEIFFGSYSSRGFGMAVDIQRNEIFRTPGRFGWDGGFGTSAYTDPAEGMIGILFTQLMMDSPQPPKVFADFWTLAYGAMK
jgi:CubicO group peptidase (beta-lactamase class C family)